MSSSIDSTSEQASSAVPQVVEHLFRREAVKMVATLTRIFGFEHLSLAEDVVQEALARALQTWPYYGIPDNPSAWIMRTARNLALDMIRRQKVFREKEPQIIASMEDLEAESNPVDTRQFENEIRDDRLRMLFACCHPSIPREAQVALALKALCAFGVTEIAAAFLTSEASVAKRLTRAKQKIRDERVSLEIPEGDELSRRLEAVLQTIYLLFNEGYKASTGDRLVKEELCLEAIGLGSFLTEHPAGNEPRCHALAALMLLTAARLPARMDATGTLLRLRDQDRTKWDKEMIARGMFHLDRSGTGKELSEYHLEAAIAACHCAAPDYDSTNWRQILFLYDRLAESNPSPIVALNRAVALANVEGPDAAMAAMDAIQDRDELESYYLFHAVRGELETRRDNYRAAAGCFRRAMELTAIRAEQAFLADRAQSCEVLAAG